MIDIIKALYPHDFSVVSKGSDDAINIFKKFLNFKVHKFKSGKNLNGWKIPKSFSVIEAKIFDGQRQIYDGKISPLGIPVLCASFKGLIKGAELIKHLYYSDILPNAIPYGWAGLYRPNERDWGFCVPKNFLKKIKKNKNYFVKLKTQEKNGHMNVLEYDLKGRNKETIIINAHNCHPYQANDDLSGCAVAIKLFQLLRKKKLNFSYKLLIAPELFGPMFYLKRFKKINKNLKGVILLKAVGNKSNLKIQKSFGANSLLDIATSIVAKKNRNIKFGNFRTVYGNDETVFESPNYFIPTISITRFPFKEYHTDLDTPERCSKKHLENTLKIVLDTIDVIEKNYVMKNLFNGLVSLSNPKYNLYLPAPAPGIDKKKYTKEKSKWNLFMNCLPMHMNGKESIISLSQKYNLNHHQIYNYLKKWENKKLLKLIFSNSI